MQQLHEQEPWHYALLTDTVMRADEALVLVEGSGVVVLANEAAGELLAVDPGALVGRAVGDFARESMMTFQDAAIRAVLENGVDVTVRDCRVTDVQGRAHRVDLTLSPVQSDRGGYVSIGIRDSGDKYQQTRLFRGLLEAAPDGMVIVDRDGVITLVNAQVERMFGYHRAELVGEPVEILVPDRYSGMHMAFRSGYVSEPRCRRWRPRTACWSRRPCATSPSAAGCRRRTTGSRTSSSRPCPTSCAPRLPR